MMKHWIPSAILMLSFFVLNGQKKVDKRVLNPEITAVLINSSQAYQVDLTTAATAVATVTAQMDGEYEEDLILKITEEGNTLIISSGFRPSFALPNDKLSAHKVISLKLEVILPEGLNVKVNGQSSNVFASGNFRELSVSLNDGNCVLEEIGEKVIVQTRKGKIIAKIPSGSIQAKSLFGKVEQNPIPEGDNHYNFRTVTGDIHIMQPL